MQPIPRADDPAPDWEEVPGRWDHERGGIELPHLPLRRELMISAVVMGVIIGTCACGIGFFALLTLGIVR